MSIAASYSGSELVALAAVIFLSAMVTAVAGFGFGLMSVPLMSLVIDLHSAVIVSSIVGVVGNGVQTSLYRRERHRPLAKRLCAAAIIGLPFGYVVYSQVSDAALRVVLGGGVLVAVAFLARGVNLTHVGPSMDWVLGFTSGVLNTSISTSGPPLVFDLQARHLAPNAFRGTINFIFLISGCVGLLIFLAGGDIQSEEVIAGLVAIPALFAGLYAGLPLARRFSPERFRVLVMVLLVVSAVAAVAKAFV